MNCIANDEPTSIFAFTGRPLDKAVGLQSNQLRHFDPAVGRWFDKERVLAASVCESF